MMAWHMICDFDLCPKVTFDADALIAREYHPGENNERENH